MSSSLWEAKRATWKVESCTPAPRAAPIDSEDILDVLFNKERGGKFTRAVSLPQLVDILVDVWEADGMFD